MTEYLSPFAADVIGICGSILFIIGFTYANLAKAMDQLLFNALNLVGAVLLLTSLSVHFNLAAVVLEVAWAGIALAGLVRAVWVRFHSPLPFRVGVGGGASQAPRHADTPHPNPSPEGEGLSS